jgi:hypothetical protein
MVSETNCIDFRPNPGTLAIVLWFLEYFAAVFIILKYKQSRFYASNLALFY